MVNEPTVGVIIPTYNRAAMLRNSLQALAQQSFPMQRLEIIIVDDGSEDDTEQVASQPYPFSVRYLYQHNSGDAAARNYGVRCTDAELLVFLDDDIVVAPEFLERLVADHDGQERRIISGTEIADRSTPAAKGVAPLNFVDLCSNNMALYRCSYLAIGDMDDLGFSGSSMWCDVDYAYRAYLQGFEFVRSPAARYQHLDYVDASLSNQIRRSHEAAYRAAVLFQKHPELVKHLPMFEDKTAIAWQGDSPSLVARKLLRKVSSSRPVLATLAAIALRQKPEQPSGWFFTRLHRWVIGGYIYRGYRCGQREARATA